MISWGGALFLVIGFLVLMKLFKLVERSRDVIRLSRHSVEVIRQSSLTDDDKEAALQKNAKELLLLFLVLASGGAAALACPLGVLWIFDRLGLLSLDSVLSVTFSPLFLAISGVAIVLALLLPTKRSGRSSEYSALDRCLHHIAFATYPAQVSIADLEDRLFASKLAGIEAPRPVFITALPRAGTTLLLECFSRLPEFASHCYRDMPFVPIPCLWNRFSASFIRSGQLHERAHGDGMQIDFDSPEALEEVLWKAFWPRHYRKDRIRPWQDGADEEFQGFFHTHMRKIVLIRRGEKAQGVRYLSKNNLNIARIATLKQLFPESTIIVPFRQPLQHASSLLEQHRNFLRIHQADPFASKYMRAIGHYDFGKNLRPVDFDHWLDTSGAEETESLEFWLKYWVAAYRHLLERRESVVFLNYEALCENPEPHLTLLSSAIQCVNADLLLSNANSIRPMRMREVDTSSIEADLLQQSEGLYRSLKENALA